MTHAYATADFQQDVSLGRTPLVQAAARDEHNCTRWMKSQTVYVGNSSAAVQTIAPLAWYQHAQISYMYSLSGI